MEEMTNEFEEVTDIEEIDRATEDENSGNLVKKIIIGTVAIGTAAAAAVVCKKLKVSDKINERRKRKLEKAGFVVFSKEELEENSDVESDIDEDTEE